VWKTGVKYERGKCVSYNGRFYICLQAHTSISTWTPSVTLSLWNPVASCPRS
jgi:chitinase